MLTLSKIVLAIRNDGVADIATSDLLAFYNANSGKAAIKKFASRAKGEVQIAALSAELLAALETKLTATKEESDAADAAIEAEYVASETAVAVVEGETATEVAQESETEAPVVRDGEGNVVNDDDVSEDELSDEEREVLLAREANAEQNGEAGEPKAKAGNRGSNSEGVARSWKDPVVRDKRLTRHGVFVAVGENSNGYQSVAEAFRSLRLPFAAHIRFRLVLKTNGKATFSHDGKEYNFTLAA